jgi:hypothetical protein
MIPVPTPALSERVALSPPRFERMCHSFSGVGVEVGLR